MSKPIINWNKRYVEEPSDRNQGMTCGCSIYYESGAGFKVVFCKVHAIGEALVQALEAHKPWYRKER